MSERETVYVCADCGHESRFMARMQNHECKPKLSDPVNSPDHYTAGGIETIDFIRAKLSREEFVGYCRGNVIKYVTRAPHKGGIEDYRKAAVYLRWAIEAMDDART